MNLSTPSLRIFFPGAAEVLTDHMPHGEGLIAHELLSGLAGRGHSIVACGRTRAFRECPPYEARAIGRGGPFGSLAPIGYAGLAARELRKCGGATSFDIAHWLFPQGDQILDALPRRLPLVVGPLSLSWPRAKRSRSAGLLVRHLVDPAFRVLAHRAMHRAGRILVSVPEIGVAAKHRQRVTVVPFGIDETAYAVAPLPRMPTVLFVGRLDRQKGIRELVHAFALLHSEVRGVKLLIAGEGGEASWITGRVRELQLEASVEQRGRVPHNEISRLIGECSLLCLPSDGEPFGMAIVEAMAGGRAVVAIDRGGPRHLVHRGGGILVPPGDERALADALRTLLVSPDRLRAMGTFNRRRVDREFALSRVLDAIELTYVEVIKELQPGSSPTRGSSG